MLLLLLLMVELMVVVVVGLMRLMVTRLSPQQQQQQVLRRMTVCLMPQTMTSWYRRLLRGPCKPHRGHSLGAHHTPLLLQQLCRHPLAGVALVLLLSLGV